MGNIGNVERSPIRQLPQALVNRIAAGEVIERPASVVKELVENALDAGATHITVEIADGGRELIRVTDDGMGIPRAELPLAFASHATSKLTCDEDLFAIRTMGFRGEALASIGSVSHARILSRTRDDESAWELLNRGGELSDVQAAAGNTGTTVEVRHLFFNVPARRKFMKGAQTEYGHIADTLLRLALPNPSVGFRLISSGRTTLDLPATSDADQRLLAAWPDEFAEQRLPVDARDAEVRLRGLIGLPELASQTPKHQHLYVNGRWIRDKFIQHALREAYRGLTEPGRHPAAILLIELPPADVDVNVHPTKAEVRFRDSGRLHGLVLGAVRECLLGSDLAPRAAPRGETVGLRNVEPVVERQTLQQQLADFFRAPPTVQPHLDLSFSTASTSGTTVSSGSIAPASTSGTAVSASSLAPASTPGTAVSASSLAPASTSGTVSSTGPIAPAALPATTSASSAPAEFRLSLPTGGMPTQATAGAAAASPVALPSSSSAASWSAAAAPERPVNAIQLHNSYLVAETDDGLVIIDQHALHERIMFERLLAQVTRGPLESQRLLLPQSVPASPQQVELLDALQPLLARLGIEASAFGPNTVAVQSFPTFLEKLDPVTFMRDLLDRAEQDLLTLSEEAMLHEVLDMMSCKAAVKAGDPLAPAEIDALLAQRHLVERTSNCPHGRPTTLRLSLRDLEKQFKRTGF